MTAAAIIRTARTEACRPWPRHVLTPPDWAGMAAALADDRSLGLVGLWADTIQAHALFLTEEDTPLLASVPIEAGAFAALSPARPGAAWFERLIHDLWGHTASGGVDGRPWLDHGVWPNSAPLALRPGAAPSAPEPPEFRPPPAEGQSQFPIGPITGGIDDPWHLRLTLQGEAVVQAEARLGYAHKGTLALMRGKAPRTAARFVARLSATATVAHSLAFALATEAALAVAAPPRAAMLRLIMLELERIAVHLSDLALIGEATGTPRVAALAAQLRERLLREIETAFGHRLMMDCVVPGGLAADAGPDAMLAVRRGTALVASGMPALRQAMERSACLTRLAGLGTVSRQQIEALAAGGVAVSGDAASRARRRLAEIEDSLRRIGECLDDLPAGETSVALPMLSGEGLARAGSAHGDVWHWLRLDHGQIAAVFPRDPAWALWPLAEQAIQSAALEDVMAIQRSFGLTSSGADL